MSHFNVTCDATLHCGRTRDRITLVVKLDKTRKSRKFRDGENLVTCGWYGIVRQPVAERGRRVVAPGIEFNAHCYQRRKDATQPHCLAGLVTAGDIINRLRAPHRPSPFFAGLCCKPEKARGWSSGWEWEVEILYFVSENITVSWLRGIWLSPSIELVENGILEVHYRRARSPLHLSKEWICTRSRSIYRENNGWENEIFPRLWMSFRFNESVQRYRSILYQVTWVSIKVIVYSLLITIISSLFMSIMYWFEV